MIRVACLSFNNKRLDKLSSNEVIVDYFSTLSLDNLLDYHVVIIIYDKKNIDIFRCIDLIRTKYSGILYILYTIDDAAILTDLYKSNINDIMQYNIDGEYLNHKIRKEMTSNLPLNYEYKNLIFDNMLRYIEIDGVKINLTNFESEILSYLIKNINKPVSKVELVKQIWGYETINDFRSLETHIKTLRKKLGRYRNNLITIWGYGYGFIERDQ